MNSTFLSRFTPSLMQPETLEALFVQRHALAERIVDLIRESIVTPAKHHNLLIGPRGIGKSHLVSLVFYRITAIEDLRQRALIAWLREEEWGVTSFLDLLLRICRALTENYKDIFPMEGFNDLYGSSRAVAERKAASLLKEFVGDKTLFLIVENLDELFKGLSSEGQKRLRSFLQENQFCTILATSQSLFNGVSLQTSPFFGFFRICHLEELAFEEAVTLVKNIATLLKDDGLASFIQTPTGRARIRAVHHLAGGNHRVYVIFSEFLTRDSLDQLVNPFMHMLDDLTPYYQARMAWLSPQQRKIVEYLCEQRRAVPVKEIARHCFITHQTAAGQLKHLRENGYVRFEASGRETFYELREPLMRLCIELKTNRGGPIRLLVDFLRLWHSHRELQKQLVELKSDKSLECEYLSYAVKAYDDGQEDLRIAACLRDFSSYCSIGNYERALEVSEELVAIRGEGKDLSKQGLSLITLGRHEESLPFFDRAVELDPDSSNTRIERGIALALLHRYEEALISFDKAIELNPNNADAWVKRGMVLCDLNRYQESLDAFDKAVELSPQNADTWEARGTPLTQLHRHEEALTSFNKAIDISPKNSQVWEKRGMTLFVLRRYEKGVDSFDKAIELNPNSVNAWDKRGSLMVSLGRLEEALHCFEKVTELEPKAWKAWQNRGMTNFSLHRYEGALNDFNKAMELNLDKIEIRKERGVTLLLLKRYEEALTSLDKAIELNPRNSDSWLNRGLALLTLRHHDEALAACDKAIDLDNRKAIAWEIRGAVLLALDRNQEALTSYDRALELDATNSSSWERHGVILRGLNRYEEALSSIDKAIELNSKSSDLWEQRGDLLGSLDRYKDTLDSFDKAIELDANNVRAWERRGLALFVLQRYEEALASLEEASKLGHNHPLPLFFRAQALIALNRWKEGSTALDVALHRLAEEGEATRWHPEFIVRHLLDNTRDESILRDRVTKLVGIFCKHGAASSLGTALVQSITKLDSIILSQGVRQLWLGIWDEVVTEIPEFQLPVRLLNVAVRFVETHDERLLLELPTEERTLLRPLLGIENAKET